MFLWQPSECINGHVVFIGLSVWAIILQKGQHGP